MELLEVYKVDGLRNKRGLLVLTLGGFGIAELVAQHYVVAVAFEVVRVELVFIVTSALLKRTYIVFRPSESTVF